MRWRACLIPLAFASVPAAAATYNEPYALVESGYRSDVRKELPVVISSIDGKSTRSTRYADPVAPGIHRIQVNFSISSIPTLRGFQYLDLDLKPCTRYRVVAGYQNLVHLATWEPRVYIEPIGECAAKFRSHA